MNNQTKTAQFRIAELDHGRVGGRGVEDILVTPITIHVVIALPTHCSVGESRIQSHQQACFHPIVRVRL